MCSRGFSDLRVPLIIDVEADPFERAWEDSAADVEHQGELAAVVLDRRRAVQALPLLLSSRCGAVMRQDRTPAVGWVHFRQG